MLLPEITVSDLQTRLNAGEDIQLIDVREPEEYEICHLPSLLIPLGDIPKQYSQIAKDKPVVIICHHGFRSAQAIQYLNQRLGFTNLLNLKGGLHEWALKVDPEMPVY